MGLHYLLSQLLHPPSLLLNTWKSRDLGLVEHPRKITKRLDLVHQGPLSSIQLTFRKSPSVPPSALCTMRTRLHWQENEDGHLERVSITLTQTCVTEYNKNIVGVASFDQILGTHLVHCKGRSCNVTVFQHLLESALTASSFTKIY